jgi:hypothetical protein
MNIQVKPNCNKQLSYKHCKRGQDSKVGAVPDADLEFESFRMLSEWIPLALRLVMRVHAFLLASASTQQVEAPVWDATIDIYIYIHIHGHILYINVRSCMYTYVTKCVCTYNMLSIHGHFPWVC